MNTTRISLNCEQANEIKIALEERIKYLTRCKEGCLQLVVECENPILKKEYSKMVKTYTTWLKDVESVLEHVNTETAEIRP